MSHACGTLPIESTPVREVLPCLSSDAIWNGSAACLGRPCLLPPPPNVRSSLALRLSRLSPLLLLAVALVALAFLFAPGGQPAQAQTTTVWSATLTVADGGVWMGFEGSAAIGTLSDDNFTYGGGSYAVKRVIVTDSNGQLQFTLDKTVPDSLKSALTLHVGNSQFALADATFSSIGGMTNDTLNWSNTGLSWSAGDTVSLSLTEPATNPPPPPQPPPAMSTEYWSDTLSVKAVDYGFGCGYRTGQPQCDAALTDDNITYHGVEYTVELLHVAYGDTLQLILDGDPKDRDGSRTERSRMALYVGDKQFLVKDAQVSYGIAENNVWTNGDAWVLTWTNSGLSWSEGDSVSLSVVTLPVGGL